MELTGNGGINFLAKVNLESFSHFSPPNYSFRVFFPGEEEEKGKNLPLEIFFFYFYFWICQFNNFNKKITHKTHWGQNSESGRSLMWGKGKTREGEGRDVKKKKNYVGQARNLNFCRYTRLILRSRSKRKEQKMNKKTRWDLTGWKILSRKMTRKAQYHQLVFLLGNRLSLWNFSSCFTVSSFLPSYCYTITKWSC